MAYPIPSPGRLELLFFIWVCCGCTGPFAGSPAPTVTPRPSNLWCTCGSGQARERAGAAITTFCQPQKSPGLPGPLLPGVCLRLPGTLEAPD
ncbi:hypothetical protein CXG50_09095 [Pseudomonas plecoglossicida]|uniref:Uncharacterized protein n=1 Tax=Pseudomonas plecoglossicida TaxID=70775 RepID=A0ABX4TYQ9_PSEDL|nr:hypothetical protein CSW00_14605 [Pseudomonas sp. MR 02]PLP93798.1 hypothetical protein CX682_06030 [Pseudomonas sp. FFUP_PS_41]PLU87449.1 hypothetical protein CXG44_09680 [Pseudomonas plecoglossicida]QKK99031.1 hypothetical protein GEV38_25085 [Pseudomonas sp. 13159349]TXI08589.1 MAG: hypothetical protein E6Q70_02095 [Pseudomonas monteilii]